MTSAPTPEKNPATKNPYSEFPLFTSQAAREVFEKSAWDTPTEAIRHMVHIAFLKLGPITTASAQFDISQDGTKMRVQIEPGEGRISTWLVDENPVIINVSLDGSVTIPCPCCHAEQCDHTAQGKASLC